MKEKVHMLPEWVKQEAVLLAWPHESTDWAPWLDAIQHDYVELVVAIASEVTPIILCQDEEHKKLIEQQLNSRCKFPPQIIVIAYNDTWCRDYGPITVAHNQSLSLLNFQFQGWGDKYDAALDNEVNQLLSTLWDVPIVNKLFELEGGSIETDGCGSLLTTKHCLLDSNRNQQYEQDEIEILLKECLGVERILWISEGALIGDDTDSHIDNLVRFCSPDTIAYASCSRKDDVHYEPLKAMEKQVKALRQADGSAYKLFAIEIPEGQFDEADKRLPASYVNFLILNNSVLVPVFGCQQDAQALNNMQNCFKDKKIVPVPGANLIKQFGGPHCATMQLPVGTLIATLNI